MLIVNIYIHTVLEFGFALLLPRLETILIQCPENPIQEYTFFEREFDTSSNGFYQIEAIKRKETNCAGVTSSLPFHFPLKCFCNLSAYRVMGREIVRRVVVDGASIPASAVQTALQSGLNIKDMWG